MGRIHLSLIDSPHKRASNVELWRSIFWDHAERTVEQSVELPVIWDAMTLTFHHCNVSHCHPEHGAVTTSFLRQNDIATSFWRNNDVIIASESCAHWEAQQRTGTNAITRNRSCS